MAVVGILVALRERDRSGLGQIVDCSMFDGALSWLAMVAADALAGGSPKRGSMAPAGSLPCYPPYACADGYVTLGALQPEVWTNFCHGGGRADPRHDGLHPPRPEPP